MDSLGLESDTRPLTLSIDEVWDNPPTGKDVFAQGLENSDCIPVRLEGATFRDVLVPVFVVDVSLLTNGELSQFGRVIGSDDAPTPYYTTDPELCFKPDANEHSVYDISGTKLLPFTSFTYRVWTGLGDHETGESPPLGSSGVFNELSAKSYEVVILVEPVF